MTSEDRPLGWTACDDEGRPMTTCWAHTAHKWMADGRVVSPIQKVGTKDQPVSVLLPVFGTEQPSPWNRVTWAEIRPMIVARLRAQGIQVVDCEEPKNVADE